MPIYGLVVSLFATILFYGAGSILFIFSADRIRNIYFSIFLKLTTGLLAISTVTAAVITSGNTVSLIFLVFGLVYIVQKKNSPLLYNREYKRPKQNLSKYITPIGITFSILLVVYSFYALLYFNGKENINNILHFDEVYYSYVSNNIGIGGSETLNPQYQNGVSQSASPYHYIELWLTFIISNIFKLNTLFTLSVIIKSICSTIFIIGIVGFTKTFSNKRIVLVISVASIFTSPILLEYTNICQAACIMHQTKFVLAACFYLWALYLHKYNSHYQAYPLLLLPIVNIAFAPIVIPILIIISTVSLYNNWESKPARNTLIITLIVACLILCFYAFQNKAESSSFLNLEDFYPFYKIEYFIIDTIAHIKNVAMYSVYFSPIILLLFSTFYYDKVKFHLIYKKIKIVSIYFLLAFCIGNIIQFIFYPFAGYDAGQINGINYFIFLSIISNYSFLIVHNNLRKGKLILYAFSFAIGLYNVIIFGLTRSNMTFNPTDIRDLQYISDISNFSRKKNLIGISILSDKELKIQDKAYARGELMNGYSTMPFCTIVDKISITNINAPTQKKIAEFPEITTYNRWQLYLKYLVENNVKISPFSKFYTHEQNSSIPTDSLQFMFTVINKVDFMIISKDAMFPSIFEQIKDTIIVDKMTEEKFVFLKKRETMAGFSEQTKGLKK